MIYKVTTCLLLERSIQGRDQAQIDTIVAEHKKAFDPYLGLFELTDLPLDKETINRLKNGEIVSAETENASIKQRYQLTSSEVENLDLMYKLVPHSNKVWRLNFDMGVEHNIDTITATTTVTSKRFVYGMQALIQQFLLTAEPSAWAQMLNDLQKEYGLPLSLHEQETLFTQSATLNADNDWKKRLIQGEVVNITQGSDQATFVQRIAGSTKLLQIGPITIPWLLRHMFHLAFFGFIFSIATMLFLWARPLWTSLMHIKQAADDFGAGRYQTRIAYKKHSAIAKVAHAFNTMAERTQHSIRSHKELTSAVSHELRTPVARMRFALEMLSSTDDKADQQRFVNDINQDIDELDKLLEELLTYARFDQCNAEMTLREVHLVPWLSNSMDKLMPLAQTTARHKTHLNYQLEGIGVNKTAWIEPRLMTRVLDNLVQNALRYAKQQVEVTFTKDKHDYLLVVEDDGVGITSTERAHIFDAFSRLDASRDRTSGGFGLGLAIADRIVKGHQGHIIIEDSALGGARFEVRFAIKGRLFSGKSDKC